MSCVVDATVLLGAAEPSWQGHGLCRALLERLWKGPAPWYFTPGILDNLYRYGTSRRVLGAPWSRNDIRYWVGRLRQSSFLRMLGSTKAHRQFALRTLQEYPGLPPEHLPHFQVAVLMRENRVERIYTNDPRYKQFLFLEVVSPLRRP